MIGVRQSSSPVISIVGVFTAPTYWIGERFMYSWASSHGLAANQYNAANDGRSDVSIQLYQLVTGYRLAAARNRSVRLIIQQVSTPPPEPPVTNRFAGST